MTSQGVGGKKEKGNSVHWKAAPHLSKGKAFFLRLVAGSVVGTGERRGAGAGGLVGCTVERCELDPGRPLASARWSPGVLEKARVLEPWNPTICLRNSEKGVTFSKESENSQKIHDK